MLLILPCLYDGHVKCYSYIHLNATHCAMTIYDGQVDGLIFASQRGGQLDAVH